MKTLPKNCMTKQIKITDDGKLSTSELLAKCKEKFDVHCYWTDEVLDKNFPPPKKKTTRHFKKQMNSDMLNKSYDEMEKEGVKNITIRERIIMELSYFEETKNHLDIVGGTITSSRYGDYVASADWHPDNRKFKVDAYDRHWRYPDYGGREAISLKPSPLVEFDAKNHEDRIKDLEKFRDSMIGVLDKLRNE